MRSQAAFFIGSHHVVSIYLVGNKLFIYSEFGWQAHYSDTKPTLEESASLLAPEGAIGGV